MADAEEPNFNPPPSRKFWPRRRRSRALLAFGVLMAGGIMLGWSTREDIATDLIDSLKDGVWWVELAPLMAGSLRVRSPCSEAPPLRRGQDDFPYSKHPFSPAKNFSGHQFPGLAVIGRHHQCPSGTQMIVAVEPVGGPVHKQDHSRKHPFDV